ncbi:MAG: hypothetical protein CSA33_08910 [Desulfobulbus propionicus]|nr:MAG: hypothetical protein CSA33_08910 [Desulfobulbus propionicus]
MSGTVSEFGSLPIKLVRRSPEKGLGDDLIDRSHSLGNPWIVGSHLKYLDDRLVASRDQFIGWGLLTRETNLHKVVNNVRFLVLPSCQYPPPCLQSVGPNTRCLQDDWSAFYKQPISLRETFIETGRYQGTCHKAASWRYVGKTKGRGKYGQQAT